MLRIRLRLRTLLALMAIVGVVCAFAASSVRRGQKYRQALVAGENISGFVDLYYAYEVELDGTTFPNLEKSEPPWPKLVYRQIPTECLHGVIAAQFIYPDDRVQELVPLSRFTHLKVLSATWTRYFDSELVHLRAFPELEYLDLSRSDNLTDRGILELAHLPKLKVLNISGSQISDSGIEALRRRLPKCTINGSSAAKPPR